MDSGDVIEVEQGPEAEYRLIASALQHTGPRLRLPDELERAYCGEQDAAAARALSNTMGYVFAVYVALGVLALLFVDTASLGYWPVSFGVFLVFITGGWLLSFSSYVESRYQLVVGVLAGIAMSWAVIHPHLLADTDMQVLVHQGTVFVVMIVYLGLNLRLVPAFLAASLSGTMALLVGAVLGIDGDWGLSVQTFGGGSVLGFLLCYRDEKSARRLFLQQRLAALDNLRTQKLANELERLSYLDGLTGVANRRYFDSMLDKAWRAGLRDNQPLTLMMLDVDFFKPYNDLYGHQEGDACLRKIAMALAVQAARPQDLAARYGGEEFVLLFPDTDAQAAARVADRVLDSIRGLAIEHQASSVAPVVTVSAGVATVVPSAFSTAEKLVEQADRSLYEAKHAGRNCWRGGAPEMPDGVP